MPLPPPFPQKTYKLSYFERVFVLMCISAPLQLYNIRFAGLGWSIDRICLLLILLMLPAYMRKRSMRIGLPQLLGLLGCLSLPMCMITGNGADAYFLDIAPSMVQGIILFGIGSYVFKDNPKTLKIALFIAIGWFVIFCTFSTYMLYFYYVKGTVHVPYPFLGYSTDYDIQKMSMVYSRRLFMPLASAPHLGAATGFTGMFLLCIYLQTKRLQAMFIGLAFLFICLLTLSRGPMLSLVLGFAVLFGVGISMNVVRLDRRFIVAMLICLTVILGLRLYQYFQIEKIGKATASRLIIDVEEISQSRHLQLKLYAFTLLKRSSLSQLLFGRGFGAFAKVGIGAYSFTDYLTLLVETGLYGATIFTLIWILPILKAWQRFIRHPKRNVWIFYVLCMAIYLFCCHLFYELKTVRELWIAAGILYGLAVTRSDILIIAADWLMPVVTQRTMPLPPMQH